MNELIGVELAKKSVDTAAKAAENFLAKLTGPVAEELGAILQDRVRVYRFKNQLSMLGKAQEMLLQAHVKPESVPLRLLLPLLDGASLEDEENLSTKWAALLANSAHLELRRVMHPS